MCRLFAIISKIPVKPNYWLLEARHSILELSKEHKHGWGLALLENRKIHLKKSAIPAYKDKSFHAYAQLIQTNLCLVHIRKAINGKVKLENTQPFVRGKWFFAHNGIIRGYRELLHLINIKYLSGDTDSEIFFNLLMKNMKSFCIELALPQTIADISKYCDYTSLNCIISDCNKLYALCDYKRELRYYTLHYLKTDRYVIVSSEKIGTAGKWQKMKNHELLRVDKKLNIQKISI